MSVQLIFLKGLPASGKSTHAKALLKKFGKGNAHRVNSDDLRAMMDNGEWSPENEKFVNGVRDHVVKEALAHGRHAIVDNCNLAPKHETNLRRIAEAADAEFVIVDFTEVPLETCLERDRNRTASVGRKVIEDMYYQFLHKPVEPPPYDPNLPRIVISDVDGTIAQMNWRGPFEWKRVGEDLVRQSVVDAVIALAKHKDAMIMVLSGRDSCCYPETERWIQEKAKIFLHPGMLHMRPVGDMRRDSIVKREIYDNHIKGKFEVVGIFDDRPQVLVETWRALGLGDRLFNVGDGREF
jgi:predicted kinase